MIKLVGKFLTDNALVDFNCDLVKDFLTEIGAESPEILQILDERKRYGMVLPPELTQRKVETMWNLLKLTECGMTGKLILNIVNFALSNMQSPYDALMGIIDAICDYHMLVFLTDPEETRNALNERMKNYILQNFKP